MYYRCHTVGARTALGPKTTDRQGGRWRAEEGALAPCVLSPGAWCHVGRRTLYASNLGAWSCRPIPAAILGARRVTWPTRAAIRERRRAKEGT